jgi:hypothetical protein
MIRLLTVTGSRTHTLRHILNHYKDIVDEIFVVVYEWADIKTYDSVADIVSEFPSAKIVDRIVAEKYNWEKVTELYNKTKTLHPNDWWVVADDDEFHIYSKPLEKIVSDCEWNGWNIVRGGFIDRIGLDGGFPEINDTENIFNQFPIAGFFRHTLSGANPNKVCIMKGSVKLLPGQHYAEINGHSNWRWQGWSHPQIAPVDKYNVQVHHFKWDSTCGERIREVANVNKIYAYSEEYRIMYRQLAKLRFKFDVSNPEFKFENVGDYYNGYSQWKEILNEIISI